MSERAAIERTTKPATVGSLTDDLQRLGVRPAMTLMVHTSLSQLGYVSGGAQAVVTALRTVVGEGGTLVMPTHSTDLSDPADWSDPPVPAGWLDTLRAEMPAYDPALTGTRSMGATVDCFRHVPGVRRSAHPTNSAAAAGPNASFIVEGHELDHGLGESSPQARLYDLDGHVLLLGVTHANNTSLHLGEYRSAGPQVAIEREGSPMLVDGERRWVSYESLADDVSDFARLGEAFAATGLERSGPVGAGGGRLMRSRDVVDFAQAWFPDNRPDWGRS